MSDQEEGTESEPLLDHRSLSLRGLEGIYQAFLENELAEDVQLYVTTEDLHEKVPTGSTIRLVGPVENSDDENDEVVAMRGLAIFGDDEYDVMFVPGENANEKSRQEWSTADLLAHMVLPAECQEGMPHIYLNFLNDQYIGDAHQGVFVCHAHQSRFSDLIVALGEFFADTDPSESFVWLDVFCANQVLLRTDRGSDVYETSLTEELHEIISSFESHVIFIDRWDVPAPLDRLWCIWEIWGFLRFGLAAPALFAQGQKEAYVSQLRQNAGNIIAVLRNVVHTFTAQCSDPYDSHILSAAIARTLDTNVEDLDAMLEELVGHWYLPYTLPAVHEAREGHDNLQLSGTLAAAAFLLHRKGETREALGFFQEAHEIQREILDPNNPLLAMTSYETGVVFESQGKFRQALLSYEEALSIALDNLGTGNPEVHRTLRRMACVYTKQERFDMALTFYHRALRDQETAFGSRDPAVALTLLGLASTYMKQGDFERAIEVYHQAEDICLHSLGPDHVTTKRVQEDMAKAISSYES